MISLSTWSTRLKRIHCPSGETSKPRGEDDLLAVRRPGEAIERSSVGSDATGSTTARAHHVNVTSKKTGSLHIGDRCSIGGENWIGDVQIGLGDQYLSLSVLNRQEQDAGAGVLRHQHPAPDRKSTRLNSSHDQISYAVFC